MIREPTPETFFAMKEALHERWMTKREIQEATNLYSGTIRKWLNILGRRGVIESRCREMKIAGSRPMEFKWK